MRYTTTGQAAQVNCPHRIRNRDGTECSTCGSRKEAGAWRYLTPAWFHYYTTGQNRPADGV